MPKSKPDNTTSLTASARASAIVALQWLADCKEKSPKKLTGWIENLKQGPVKLGRPNEPSKYRNGALRMQLLMDDDTTIKRHGAAVLVEKEMREANNRWMAYTQATSAIRELEREHERIFGKIGK